MIGVSAAEIETDTASLTDSEKEEFVFNTESEIPLAGTRSGRQFSKSYDEAGASPSNPAEKAVEQPLKKQKESRFSKPLRIYSGEGSSAPFQFDVMAQLANIPARITLHELQRLSKSTREALREALADSEAFLTHIPALPEKAEDSHCPRCHLTSEQI